MSFCLLCDLCTHTSRSAVEQSLFHAAKKNPRRDFAHMQLSNVEPMVEGEAPVLIRTGSDGCLNESAGTSILQVSVRRA